MRGLITAEKGRGYTHPFKHLLSCVANGNESELYDIYYTELENCRRSTGLQSRLQYIPNASSASYREKAMYSYLKLIVLKLPLSIIEDSTLRDFSKYSERFSVKTLKETIFKLVQLVEETITNEMKTTKGSLMLDGWSECSIHYIGVFAVYMKCSKEIENGIILAEKRLCIALQAASPMSMIVQKGNFEETNSDKLSTDFGANTHIRFFEDVFHLYNLDVRKCVVCLLEDNCNVNRRIARKMEKPLVGCCFHKINLEVQSMINRDT